MARSLNNYIAVFCVLMSVLCRAQSEADAVFRPHDYKEGDQFSHFKKKRDAISKWQINQLKNGALIVRLHDNRMLIESLKKKGMADIAVQKEHEAFALNKNIVRAFIKNYTFSKVYFFYGHNSDSLLSGARSGIFLDSNLVVDPSITLTENFYMLAEKDLIYNSSIGFVPEDTAKFVREAGNSSKEMGVVIKNKYGHQLKDPFPFCVEAKGSSSATVKEYYNYRGATIRVEMTKRYSGAKYLVYVQKLNNGLLKFYAASKNYEVTNPELKPFLY
ncbi:MAG: hypothetical protein ACXVP0_07285 [Bacteroidia bacterium]